MHIIIENIANYAAAYMMLGMGIIKNLCPYLPFGNS